MLKNSPLLKNNSSLSQNVQTHLKQRKPSTSSLPATKFRNTIIRSSIKTVQPDNGIRLKNSYYNDQDTSYIRKSTSLLNKSKSYQSKPISQSIRKRIQTQKAEQIVNRRKNSSFYSVVSDRPSRPELTPRANLAPQTARPKSITSEIKTPRLPRTAASPATSRLKTNSSYKLSVKLPIDPEQTKMKQRVLDSLIKQKIQSQNLLTKEWTSPFKKPDTKNYSNKPLATSRTFLEQQKILEGSRDQLKVLNLDRLFKGSKGDLKTKIQLHQKGASAQKPYSNQAMKPNPINYIIGEFNNLCKIQKLLKVKKIRPVVTGKQCIQQPTLEELLGIKVQDLKRWKYQQEEFVSKEVFKEYCVFFKNNMRRQLFLVERMLNGFIGSGSGLNLQAYIRFHEIFVSKSASKQRKIQFLQHFFVPSKQTLDLEMFKLTMQLLCQKLPALPNPQLDGTELSKEEKSSIFYETLMRVLVGPFQGRLRASGDVSRQDIREILQRSEESIDLILSLFLDEKLRS